MTDGWRVARLGDVCSFEKEQDIHADLPYVGLENIESGTGRFLGTTNAVSVKSATFRFSPAHVLYGRLRPYLNKVLLPRFEGHCSTEIFPIKPGPEISRDYLFHWLSMDATVKAIDATATGARMPRANMTAVLDFELSVPPLLEQRRIVAILDEAFEGIATAKANAEKNLRNARELFETTIARVFGQRSDLWRPTKLADAFVTLTGNTPSKSNAAYFGDFTPLVKPPELLDDYIADVADGVSEAGAEGARVLPANSVLVSCIGNLGKVGINDAPVACNQQINAILPDEGKALPEFMFFQALSMPFKDQLAAAASGTTVPIVNKSKFNQTEIVLPPLEEQAVVVEALWKLRYETGRLAVIHGNKLAALDELKKSLLHQAFSGAL